MNFCPEFIFVESRTYKDKLKLKTSRSEEDFIKLFDIFEKTIILMPKEEINLFIEKAEKISLDLKDVWYVA